MKGIISEQGFQKSVSLNLDIMNGFEIYTKVMFFARMNSQNKLNFLRTCLKKWVPNAFLETNVLTSFSAIWKK